MNVVDYFSANIGNTPYLNVASSFYYQIDPKTKVRSYVNSSVEFVRRVTVKSGSTKLSLTEDDFIAAIDSLVNAYRIPIDQDALYTVTK